MPFPHQSLVEAIPCFAGMVWLHPDTDSVCAMRRLPPGVRCHFANEYFWSVLIGEGVHRALPETVRSAFVLRWASFRPVAPVFLKPVHPDYILRICGLDFQSPEMRVILEAGKARFWENEVRVWLMQEQRMNDAQVRSVEAAFGNILRSTEYFERRMDPPLDWLFPTR